MIPFLGDIFKGAQGIISQFVAAPEKQLEANQKLVELQIQANQQMLDYEATLVREQSLNVRAEAAGHGTLQRNWRPVVMLTFAGMMVAHWMGYTAPNLSEAQVLHLMDIIQLGLGGYVIGRSAEKIVPAVAAAMKKDK